MFPINIKRDSFRFATIIPAYTGFIADEGQRSQFVRRYPVSNVHKPQLRSPKFIKADTDATTVQEQLMASKISKLDYWDACRNYSITDEYGVKWVPIGYGEWYFRAPDTGNEAKWEKWLGSEKVEEGAPSDQLIKAIRTLNVLISQNHATQVKLSELALQFEQYQAETLEN